MTAPASRQALRRNSAPYQALERLFDAGGRIPVRSFIDLVPSMRNRMYRLRGRILASLEGRSMIVIEGDMARMLQAGYAYVREIRQGEPVKKAEPVALTPSPSRTPPEFKPLPIGALRPPSRREGADDYKQIPSLLGGKRVVRQA